MRFRVLRKTIFTRDAKKVRQLLRNGYRLVSMAYWVDVINPASYKLEKVA